jgi:GMC oxidoreductase
MGIYETLAKQLGDIQSTTFSIDAIGSRVCSSWDAVAAHRFDVVIIGAGMFGAYCAEKLFRRDTSKQLRILVLEAGPFFLPTHVNNLPLRNMSDKAVWARPWIGEPPFVTKDNEKALAFCVGGRSLFWAGWSPELTPVDLEKWPDDVRDFLNSPEGYDRTATEIGSNQKTEFIEDTDTYKILYEAFKTAEGKVFDDGRINRIEPAPLAVMGSRPTPGVFPFDQYSSVTFLIDAINQDVNSSGNTPGDRRLMLLPRAEVIGLTLDEKKDVTSLRLELGDAKQGAVPKTLPLASGTTVILANGTIEATRLALAHLGVGQQAQPPKVGNFMTHMGNSTTVQIRRKALGLGPPNHSGNDVAAFMARGEAFGRRFHYQIVAAALRPDSNSPWDFVMRSMPDVDELERWIGDRDPDWISIVFRGIGEMQDDRRLNAAGEWRNSISLKGDQAYVKLSPSDADTKLWDAMDKVAIELANHLVAGNSQDIRYPKDPNHSDIGTTYHEGGTLFMGKAGESITDTHGRFHDLPNVYVVGPAVFPTLGSANPSLTGLSLARRTADAILKARAATA